MSKETQVKAIRKYIKNVKRLLKELGRRQKGGSNWLKTRKNLERNLKWLHSAIQAYYGEGGASCDLVAQADRVQEMGRKALREGE